jgi:hypothetical protein
LLLTSFQIRWLGYLFDLPHLRLVSKKNTTSDAMRKTIMEINSVREAPLDSAGRVPTTVKVAISRPNTHTKNIAQASTNSCHFLLITVPPNYFFSNSLARPVASKEINPNPNYTTC